MTKHLASDLDLQAHIYIYTQCLYFFLTFCAFVFIFYTSDAVGQQKIDGLSVCCKGNVSRTNLPCMICYMKVSPD